MSGHAILSASGAHRWINCTPSARLELEFEDQAGKAAEEGTAAHALAEHKLRLALGMDTQRPASPYDCAEMEGYTDDYAAFVMEQFAEVKQTCSDPIILIEQRLDFSRYVPEGFGTGDCVIIADRLLHIIDLKYGQGVLVSAASNPQMKLYALGALDLFDGIYDIGEVSMTIFQPRRENVGTYTVFKESLYQWAEDVLMPAAQAAFNGDGEYRSGEWCRFCRAAIKCRARAEEKQKLTRFEFKLPPLLADGDIEEILSQLDDLTSWANDIRGYALEAAVSHGKEWQGFKLVEGRSLRKYTNEEAIAQAAIASGYPIIYRQSLIPLTEMEALMGKARFQEVLGGLIEKPPGKPTLVPATDKRPAIKTSAKHDFEEET